MPARPQLVPYTAPQSVVQDELKCDTVTYPHKVLTDMQPVKQDQRLHGSSFTQVPHFLLPLLIFVPGTWYLEMRHTCMGRATL
jgi:hypothetical protein